MQTSYTCFINREQDMTIFKKIDNVIVGMDPSISKATAAPDWDVNFFLAYKLVSSKTSYFHFPLNPPSISLSPISLDGT